MDAARCHVDLKLDEFTDDMKAEQEKRSQMIKAADIKGQ